MRKKALLALLVVVFLGATLLAADEARLLRFPAIHGNTIVFTYAGDLYSVPADGGIARRLTSYDGFESFARFSPDGKWIAFTGQYDGNTEVYLIPADGGVPRRLTVTATLNRDQMSDRMGPNNIVMTWKKDNRHVVFRSRMHEFDDFKGQLYTASVDGGLPEQIPVPRGGFCTFSPDDSQMAYNRVFREFRTWKRYRGGMADDIWVYNFKTKVTTNITDNPAQDIIPMWIGDKIYFLSDRDEHKRMNLFVYDTATRQTRQLTHFTDFDIKFPSNSETAIVFENGGWIYRYDLATDKAVKVPIQIHNDQILGRGGLTSVAKNVAGIEIAPDGKRALFSARGDIFTVPAENGITRNLTESPGVHDRDPKWSPDGRWIAYISDASGEDEIYIVPQDGSAPATRLTTGGDTYKYALSWSPDSGKILWTDRKLRVLYVDVASKETTLVTQTKVWEIRDAVWSPDSRWIAYSQQEVESMPKVYLYSLDGRQSTEVTDGWYSATDPVFSTDGKYLFFVSNRDFHPTYSSVEWNYAYQDMARIYLLTLAKATPSPFAPENDEVVVKKQEPAKTDADAKPAAKAEAKPKATPGTVEVTVDLDGIKDRVVGLPIDASRYFRVATAGDSVYYVRRGSKDTKPVFLMYDLDKKKETELGNIFAYEISSNLKKMIVGHNGQYAIIDLPKGKIQLSKHLDLSGLQVKLDRHAEWTEIFNESWRQMRDFFYDPHMHGLDWKAVHDRYAQLLPYVNHRADLTYIIGEMIGELSIGHAYVGGGDLPKIERIKTGLLGARLEKDPASGYFRIIKILRGENWDKSVRSPLTEIGVNASEGDYIIAVDSQPTNTMTDIYAALIGTAGKTVQLTFSKTPTDKDSWTALVVPVASEASLYYYNWVQDNTRKVNEATNDQIGYIHIPDMGPDGLNEFVKHFYPQLRKKGLIIDVRGNGGGNVSPMIIERLRREVAMMEVSRNTVPHPDPEDVMVGPLVCLCDEFSASDGDIFPYRFKTQKLGILIGKRTWGGVVGIRGALPQVDGGTLTRPEFAPYSVEGKGWVIEGHGVDPDIVVDNDPAKEYAGIDQQLNKAIEVIMQELKTKGKTLPPVPPYPDKKN